MIHHLNGRLIEKHPTHIVIECGGVGYLVSISLTTFEALPDDEKILKHYMDLLLKRNEACFFF